MIEINRVAVDFNERTRDNKVRSSVPADTDIKDGDRVVAYDPIDHLECDATAYIMGSIVRPGTEWRIVHLDIDWDSFRDVGE